jgi:mycothiol synthase
MLPIHRTKKEPPTWWTAVPGDDGHQAVLLRELGYTIDEKPFMQSTLRDLSIEIPPITLPDGFTIRSSTEADVEQLCAVHSSAFGSKWTPPEYLNVMHTPGFDPARERVVVAPDGQFAAFCVWWPDPVSKSAEFEPVGCHADFQRHGLTRALMYDTMHLMRAAGMTHAVVIHQVEEDNPASAGLYRAAGFRPHYGIHDARKIIG